MKLRSIRYVFGSMDKAVTLLRRLKISGRGFRVIKHSDGKVTVEVNP